MNHSKMLSDDMLIEDDDYGYSTNTAKRLPVVICIDTSGSMNYDAATSQKNITTSSRIDLVNKGIQKFYEVVNKSNVAANSVELSIVTFDSNIKVHRPFATLDIGEKPTLTAKGMTFMGQGVNKAIDVLEEHREILRKNSIAHFKSWLIIMSDGRPFNKHDRILEEKELQRAAERCQKLTDEGVLIWTIGLNENDHEGFKALKRFSKRTVSLVDMQIESLFDWLASSTVVTSTTDPITGSMSTTTSKNLKITDILKFEV
jgi:uncharacterized protein YegL